MACIPNREARRSCYNTIILSKLYVLVQFNFELAVASCHLQEGCTMDNLTHADLSGILMYVANI